MAATLSCFLAAWFESETVIDRVFLCAIKNIKPGDEIAYDGTELPQQRDRSPRRQMSLLLIARDYEQPAEKRLADADQRHAPPPAA
jgi:hypothetical protein